MSDALSNREYDLLMALADAEAVYVGAPSRFPIPAAALIGRCNVAGPERAVEQALESNRLRRYIYVEWDSTGKRWHYRLTQDGWHVVKAQRERWARERT